MGKKIKEFLSFLNGFRKFSFMILLLTVAIIFRVLEYINGAEFVDLMKGTTIGFLATNGIEHTTKVIREWLAKKVRSETIKKASN